MTYKNSLKVTLEKISVEISATFLQAKLNVCYIKIFVSLPDWQTLLCINSWSFIRLPAGKDTQRQWDPHPEESGGFGGWNKHGTDICNHGPPSSGPPGCRNIQNKGNILSAWKTCTKAEQVKYAMNILNLSRHHVDLLIAWGVCVFVSACTCCIFSSSCSSSSFVTLCFCSSTREKCSIFLSESFSFSVITMSWRTKEMTSSGDNIIWH